MKKTSLFILLFSLLLTDVFSQCADTINIYDFTFNGKTYEVIKELKSWDTASACAVERGGYLVEINTVEEQNAVYDAIISGAGVSPTYVSITNGGGIAYVWIGATDKNIEDTWLWDGNNDSSGVNFWNGQGANGANDGVAVGGAYNNWGGTSTGTVNEPDNYGSGQDYGAIALAGWPSGTTMLGVAGEWNDIIGTSSLYYVIEYDSTITSVNSCQEHKLEIYPNPTNGLVFIKGENIKNIEVVDLMGKVIGNFKNLTIDLNSYKKGIYFINIRTNNTIDTKKIVLK